MPDLESEVIKTDSGQVIGTIEYSAQYDLWYVRSIHSGTDVKLFHDYGHAVRWIHGCTPSTGRAERGLSGVGETLSRMTVEERIAHQDWACGDFQQRRYERCELVEVDASEAEFTGCVFDNCELTGVRFNAAVLTRCAFLSCTLRRCVFFGATLEDCKLTGSSFVECELRPLTVTGGDWSYVSLRGQELAGINLRSLKLRESDFTEADLTKADLRDADLAYARVHHTRLRGADLRGANLEGVQLRGLDFTDVRVDLAQAALFAAAHGARIA